MVIGLEGSVPMPPLAQFNTLNWVVSGQQGQQVGYAEKGHALLALSPFCPRMSQ